MYYSPMDLPSATSLYVAAPPPPPPTTTTATTAAVPNPFTAFHTLQPLHHSVHHHHIGSSSVIAFASPDCHGLIFQPQISYYSHQQPATYTVGPPSLSVAPSPASVSSTATMETPYMDFGSSATPLPLAQFYDQNSTTTPGLQHSMTYEHAFVVTPSAFPSTGAPSPLPGWSVITTPSPVAGTPVFLPTGPESPPPTNIPQQQQQPAATRTSMTTSSDQHPTPPSHSSGDSQPISPSEIHFSSGKKKRSTVMLAPIPPPAPGRTEALQIVVHYLSTEINDTALRTLFSQFPGCTHARVVPEAGTGRSRGFGYVWYSNQAQAITAIDESNGRVLLRKRIRVAFAVPQAPPW